ncbi:MAG: putative phosphoesterase [Patiriisocius sp.]
MKDWNNKLEIETGIFIYLRLAHIWNEEFMKKIGLLSDTHSYIDDRILSYLDGMDEIWHAGDIGDLKVTDALRELAPLRVVYGNIDDNEARSEFQLHHRFMCEKVKVWMTHIGGPPYVYDYRIREPLKQDPPDLFICGHSHICKVQMDKRLNMLYMNPGAAGRHGHHKIRTLLRFTIEEKKIGDLEVVELGNRSKIKA